MQQGSDFLVDSRRTLHPACHERPLVVSAKIFQFFMKCAETEAHMIRWYFRKADKSDEWRSQSCYSDPRSSLRAIAPDDTDCRRDQGRMTVVSVVVLLLVASFLRP